MEQKSENNSTESVGRIISFCLCHPIPQASTAQHQEGILWPERVPLIRAGCTSFPSPSGHCTKELFWFCPTQKPAKLRKLETARNKENGQYHLGSVHYSVTSTPLCGGSAAFSTEETNSQHSYHQALPIAFSPESPTVAFADSSCLSPSPHTTPHSYLSCLSHCLCGNPIPISSRAILPASSWVSAIVHMHAKWGCQFPLACTW